MEIKNNYTKPTQDGRKKRKNKNKKTFQVTKEIRKKKKSCMTGFKKCIFKFSLMWTHKKLSLIPS